MNYSLLRANDKRNGKQQGVEQRRISTPLSSSFPVVRLTAQTLLRLFQQSAREEGRCLLLDLRWESGLSRMYG